MFSLSFNAVATRKDNKSGVEIGRETRRREGTFSIALLTNELEHAPPELC